MDLVDRARYILLRDMKQHVELSYSPQENESQLQHLLVVIFIPAEDDRDQLDQLNDPLTEEVHRRLEVFLGCSDHAIIEGDDVLDPEQHVKEGLFLWFGKLRSKQ